MKRLIIFLLFVLSSLMAHTQIDPAYRYNWQSPSFLDTLDVAIADAISANPNDTDEGGLLNKLNRHRYFMGSRVCNDVRYGEDVFKPLNAAMKTYMSAINTFCPGIPSKYTGQWECIGPFQNTFNTNNYESIGRINGIWVSPNDTNHILAGADAGGLWKSTNGGANWQNITDASASNGSNLVIPGSLGIKYIAVNPLDHNNIVLLVKMESQYQRSWGYTLGMVYSKTTYPFVG